MCVCLLYEKPWSCADGFELNPPFFISADTKQRTQAGLPQAMEILLSCAYSLLWLSHPFVCLCIYTPGDNPTTLKAIALLVLAFVCQRDFTGPGSPWWKLDSVTQEIPPNWIVIALLQKVRRGNSRTAQNWTLHETTLGQGFCCWDKAKVKRCTA